MPKPTTLFLVSCAANQKLSDETFSQIQKKKQKRSSLEIIFKILHFYILWQWSEILYS